MEKKIKLTEQVHQAFYFCRECSIYLTTLTFSLLAIFSAATFCFLVPLVLEPALATIQHDFRPTTCVTISGEWVEGKNKCDWSSCREGCTKEIFTCWKIRVSFVMIRENNNTQHSEGNLFPNVYGCGYPPRVVCDEFSKNYGVVGSQFSCYFSSINHDIVITHLDEEEIWDSLVYGVTIPCTTFIISIIYLVLAYIYIYPREEKAPVKVKLEYEHVSTTEETEQSPEDVIRKKHKQDVDNDRKVFRQQLYTEQNKFIDF